MRKPPFSPSYSLNMACRSRVLRSALKRARWRMRVTAADAGAEEEEAGAARMVPFGREMDILGGGRGGQGCE